MSMMRNVYNVRIRFLPPPPPTFLLLSLIQYEQYTLENQHI